MDTIFVWCDFADDIAWTRFDGATHFCSNCGSTDHAEVTIKAREVNEHDI